MTPQAAEHPPEPQLAVHALDLRAIPYADLESAAQAAWDSFRFDLSFLLLGELGRRVERMGSS